MTLNPARTGDASAARECTCECGCRERTPFYPSDLTDEQWAVLEPGLPVMLCGTVTGGRPEVHGRRTMIDAVFYLLDNGIKWRAMPRGFPKWQTVHDLYKRWRDDGVIEDIRDRLRARVRTAAGRDPEPSAVIIGAQSVHESAEGVVPAATSGFGGHKKVSGRKRHVMTDTMGLLTGVAVSAANVPDQSGAVVLLLRARRRGRARIRKAWTDKGYSGDAWQQWPECEPGIEIEIVELVFRACGACRIGGIPGLQGDTPVLWWLGTGSGTPAGPVIPKTFRYVPVFCCHNDRKQGQTGFPHGRAPGFPSPRMTRPENARH